MTQQPTFTEGPPVPLMVDGQIDAATLNQLFADLGSYATILGIREKAGPTTYTGDRVLSVEETKTRLLAGLALAVQIRYQYAEHEWTDTILTLPNSFRVVRCRHEHFV